MRDLAKVVGPDGAPAHRAPRAARLGHVLTASTALGRAPARRLRAAAAVRAARAALVPDVRAAHRRRARARLRPRRVRAAADRDPGRLAAVRADALEPAPGRRERPARAAGEPAVRARRRDRADRRALRRLCRDGLAGRGARRAVDAPVPARFARPLDARGRRRIGHLPVRLLDLHQRRVRAWRCRSALARAIGRWSGRPGRWRFMLAGALAGALLLYHGQSQIVLIAGGRAARLPAAHVAGRRAAGADRVLDRDVGPGARACTARSCSPSSSCCRSPSARSGTCGRSTIRARSRRSATRWPTTAPRSSACRWAAGSGSSPARYGTYFLGVIGLPLLAVGLVWGRRTAADAVPAPAAVRDPGHRSRRGPADAAAGPARVPQVVPGRSDPAAVHVRARGERGDRARRRRRVVDRRAAATWPARIWRWVVAGGDRGAARGRRASWRPARCVRRRRDLLGARYARRSAGRCCCSRCSSAAAVVVVGRWPCCGGRAATRARGAGGAVVVLAVLLRARGRARACTPMASGSSGRTSATGRANLDVTPGQAFMLEQPGADRDRVLTFGEDANRMGAVGLLQADGNQAIYPVAVPRLLRRADPPAAGHGPGERRPTSTSGGTGRSRSGRTWTRSWSRWSGARWLYVRGDEVPTVPGRRAALPRRRGRRDGLRGALRVPAGLPGGRRPRRARTRRGRRRRWPAADLATLRGTAFVADGRDADVLASVPRADGCAPTPATRRSCR